MHKEKLMPVLHQIKSRSGSSGSTNKQNRTSALMAVNEGLKTSETGENDTMEDDSTSRSFAEGGIYWGKHQVHHHAYVASESAANGNKGDER